MENVQGAGPYRTAAWGGLIDKMTTLGLNPDQCENHPAPNKDHGLKEFFANTDDISPWLFGFETINAYKAWFETSEVRNFLQENGFFLTCYETKKDEVVHGDKQSLFKRKGAVIKHFADANGNIVNESGMTSEMTNLVVSRSLLYDLDNSEFAIAA